MESALRALLGWCVLLSLPLAAAAQTEPVIFKAESATISSLYSLGSLNGATYVTIVNDSPGFGPPATADGALTYSVTFPAAGNYELYARFRVGPNGGNDDSFFIGNGFGDKVGTAQWVLVNQVDGGGYTAPADTVRNGGPATTNGRAVAVDADSDTTFSQWQPEYSTEGIFAIDANSGVITVADPVALQAVPKGTTLKLFVSVWDGYQRSKPNKVFIEVQ